jgi:multisubunit Na+/H+ antiporter MnhB subunit
MFAWDSWHTLVPLLVGIAGILGFAFYEQRLSAKAFDSEGKVIPGNNIQPIIRFSIFNNWTLRLLYLQTLAHGIILWSLLYFLPLYYEGVKGYTPIITGVAVLPETLLIARKFPSPRKYLETRTDQFPAVSIVVGILSSSTGRYRWAVWGAWGMITLGCGLLYLLNPDTSVVAFIFLNVPVAIGTGMAFISMSLGIQAAGRPQDAAHAITFYAFIRVFGQSLGVAVGGVVFQNQIQRELSKYPLLAPLAREYSKDATAVVGLIRGMEAGRSERTQLVQAYADSLKMIWVVMAALSGAVLISTLFVKGYSLNQKHETFQGLDHGDRERVLDEKDQSAANCMR